VAFQSIGKFVNNLKQRDRTLPKEMLARTFAMDYANNDESGPPRSSSVDTTESTRGSIDSAAGVDKVDNEIAAAGLTLVRSDGTEVQSEEGPLEDVFGTSETIKPPERPVRKRAPSDTPAETPNGSGTDTPKPPLLRRAISSFTNKATMSQTRRRPSVSFLTPSNGGFTPSTPPTNQTYALPSPRSERPRHSRRGSVVAHLTLSPAKPTTRLRSKSNVDMVDLVERYSREGPAMQTVVYTPSKGTTDLPDEDADLVAETVVVPVGGEDSEQGVGGMWWRAIVVAAKQHFFSSYL
jgi:hypothetical protein